jgi:hypothetical protein
LKKSCENCKKVQSEKTLKGFEPVYKKNEVENCWLAKSSGWVYWVPGWVGGSKSSFMDCLHQSKISLVFKTKKKYCLENNLCINTLL